MPKLAIHIIYRLGVIVNEFNMMIIIRNHLLNSIELILSNKYNSTLKYTK